MQERKAFHYVVMYCADFKFFTCPGQMITRQLKQIFLNLWTSIFRSLVPIALNLSHGATSEHVPEQQMNFLSVFSSTYC